jgi:hypothetical protein
MNVWYDKLISTLGLDGHRTDRLFGVAEHEVIGLEALQAGELTRVSLNRLLDGRRLLLFQFGPYQEGALWPMPCSRANAETLGGFLCGMESYLPPAGATEDSRRGAGRGLRNWLAPGRPVAVMPPLPDRHYDVQIKFQLQANHGGYHSLEMLGRAQGGRCRYYWRWSRALAADWQKILAVLQASLTDWPGSPQPNLGR